MPKAFSAILMDSNLWPSKIIGLAIGFIMYKVVDKLIDNPQKRPVMKNATSLKYLGSSSRTRIRDQ